MVCCRVQEGAWVWSLVLLLLVLVLAQSTRCKAETETETETEQGGTAEPAVEPLGDTNWTLILSGEWMLQFHAPWCPACKQIQVDWEDLGKARGELGIHVGKVDVTREPGLSGRFFVTTLPTIYHAKEGVFRKYHGARMLEDFQSFIKEKKWEAVESISGWKSPSSIVMSGMAGLFRLSVWIRQMHSYLTETMGIPVWGSYIIFALATLVVGLVLGLILVLIADCICPPKRHDRREVSEVIEVGNEAEDEEEEEEEEDYQEGGEKKAPEAPGWRANGSEAEEEGEDPTCKACEDNDSPVEGDLGNSEHEDELEPRPSSSETEGALRKRILKEDS
ncbi:LOW QUALITY PROTEIN: thioredoxin-related transmembrane protein 4 [Rhinoraja longicauda]